LKKLCEISPAVHLCQVQVLESVSQLCVNIDNKEIGQIPSFHDFVYNERSLNIQLMVTPVDKGISSIFLFNWFKLRPVPKIIKLNLETSLNLSNHMLEIETGLQS
jgi:hypothetical protein